MQSEDGAASEVINSIRSSVQEKDIGPDESSHSKGGNFGKNEGATTVIKDDDGILMTGEMEQCCNLLILTVLLC